MFGGPFLAIPPSLSNAGLAAAWPSLRRAIMLVVSSATYGLTLSGDASATDGPGATDVVLVLVSTPSLPAALGPTTPLTAWLRSLCTCVGRPSGPSARTLAT